MTFPHYNDFCLKKRTNILFALEIDFPKPIPPTHKIASILLEWRNQKSTKKKL